MWPRDLGLSSIRSASDCIASNRQGNYYALVKRGGKQFRRSLKTIDRKPAERRLADVRQKVMRLTRSESANHTFEHELHRTCDGTAAQKRRSLRRHRDTEHLNLEARQSAATRLQEFERQRPTGSGK